MEKDPQQGEPTKKRGFASLTQEMIQTVGSKSRRDIESARVERHLRDALGREPTPEERLAHTLSEGALLHAENGDDARAEKNADIANRLRDGGISLSDAYVELLEKD